MDGKDYWCCYVWLGYLYYCFVVENVDGIMDEWFLKLIGEYYCVYL